MARKRANRSAMPPLTTSFRCTRPSTRAPSETASGRAARRRRCGRPPRPPRPAWPRPAPPRGRATASTAPLRMIRPARFEAAHAGLGAEGDEGVLGRQLAAAQAVALLGQHHDGAPLRRLVGQAGELGGVGQGRRLRTPGAGRSSVAMRLPRVMVPVLSSSSTSTSPAASTARPLMASTFLRRSRSMPAMPMAESSPPMVVGMRQTRSATTAVTESVDPGVGGQRHQGDAGHQEDHGEPHQQDVEGDLVGRLLAGGPLHQARSSGRGRTRRDRR